MTNQSAVQSVLQQLAVVAFETGDDAAAFRFASLLTRREQNEVGRLVLESVAGSGAEVEVAVEVETSHGTVVLIFARRAGERGRREVSMYGRQSGRRVALTAEQSSRIWFERTSPLGMGLPIDPAAAQPGDMLHVVPDGAERWADIRTVKVLTVVRADGSYVLGDDDLEVVEEEIETEGIAA